MADLKDKLRGVLGVVKMGLQSQRKKEMEAAAAREREHKVAQDPLARSRNDKVDEKPKIERSASFAAALDYKGKEPAEAPAANPVLDAMREAKAQVTRVTPPPTLQAEDKPPADLPKKHEKQDRSQSMVWANIATKAEVQEAVAKQQAERAAPASQPAASSQ